MIAKTSFAFFFAFAVISTGLAQSPAPVVVQAVPTANAPTAVAAPGVTAAEGSTAALKALQELKAANDDILTKQAATLLQLDELDKAAEQIKVYSKRG